jgi:aminoglycoside 2'-N-acetyltransferase I
VRTIEVVASGDLPRARRRAVRALLDEAFDGDFTDDDWAHTLGGLHVLCIEGGLLVAHASVVPRTIEVGDLALGTGYVEGVATATGARRRGHASAVLDRVGRVIDATAELGVLSTGLAAFYRRFGWRSWSGPSAVRRDDVVTPTPEDDGGIMVLAVARTPPLDLDGPITCRWRPGDVW